MDRLLLLTTIITVVYSWEDFKAVLLHLIRRNRRRDKVTIDRAVGNALLISTAPASIVWLLSGDGSISTKLGVLLIHLGIVIVLMELIRLIRIRFFTDGIHAAAAVARVYGRTDFFGEFVTGSKVISIYTKALIWPVLIGIMLKLSSDNLGSSEMERQMDILVLVAIAGLVMNLTISFLSKIFRTHRFGMFEYFRILLGLMLFLWLM